MPLFSYTENLCPLTCRVITHNNVMKAIIHFVLIAQTQGLRQQYCYRI